MGAETPVTVTDRDEARPATELFVIQNPAAGMRRPERLRRRLEAALDRRGVRYEHAYTAEPGHAGELARQALTDGFTRVLVAGGDGTVLETVSAMAGRDAALAVLPVGTGNQLAANLGIPRSLKRSVDIALSGRPRVIDLGLIDGRPFSCIAGAGFDAAVVRPAPDAKRRFGYLAYVHAALGAMSSPETAEFRIRIDGEELCGRGIGVEITNMPGLTAPGLPGALPIVPEGGMDDGLLDGCLLAVETAVDCVKALGSIITRRFDRDGTLVYFKGREIEVEADPPLRVQADGDRLGLTPFVARVWPGALTVLVPRAQGRERLHA